MKIILVGSGVVSIPPQKGGATELIIYELSKFLARRKHSVVVMDLKGKSNKKEEIVEGARYERLSVPRFNNIFLLRLSEFLFGLKALIKAIKDDADIIHCQTVFSALPFALLKRFVPGKLIYTSHNPAWTENKNDPFNLLVLKIEGFIMKRVDLTITVSKDMKVGIMKKASIKSDKIHVIYNFVDTGEFYPKGKIWKKRMKISSPIVLFISKLTKKKGVEYFIRSAKLVRERIPNVKFVLAGPMSFEYEARNIWQDMVKELELQDTVLFAGAVSPEELPFVYSSADMFCFPTLREAFGIVVIEAMACGLPVITSDLPVLREVTGNRAVFVKPGDCRALANEIIRLYTDKKKLRNMSKNSVLRAKHFEKSKIMRGYEELYSTIA